MTSLESESRWNRNSKSSVLKQATTGGEGEVEVEEEEEYRFEIESIENSCCFRLCPSKSSIAVLPKLQSAVRLCTVGTVRVSVTSGRSSEPKKLGAATDGGERSE